MLDRRDSRQDGFELRVAEIGHHGPHRPRRQRQCRDDRLEPWATFSSPAVGTRRGRGLDGRFANPPFLFGGGGVELLAKEMTADLQRALVAARDAETGSIKRLTTHRVDFGHIETMDDRLSDDGRVLLIAFLARLRTPDNPNEELLEEALTDAVEEPRATTYPSSLLTDR